jgi:mRNA interferase MazF
MTTYTPNRGDIVWIRLGDGHPGQDIGRSPVLVLSPADYNQATGLLLACPITSQVKGYPFEVPVAQDFLDGAILADQIISLEWPVREVKLVLNVSPGTLAAVQSKLQLLVS